MMSFHPHGDTGYEVRGNIAVFHSYNSSNREEVERLLVKLSETLAALDESEPWGALVVVKGAALMTPDAEALARNDQATPQRQRQVGLAIVMEDVGARMLIQVQVKRVHEQAPFPVRYFDDEAAAMDWLNRLIDERRRQDASRP